jgi:hypothetical protein
MLPLQRLDSPNHKNKRNKVNYRFGDFKDILSTFTSKKYSKTIVNKGGGRIFEKFITREFRTIFERNATKVK